MRVKLSEQYPKEREEICNKLINILQLAPDNSFLLSEFDADEEKQHAILEMKPEIQQYFAVSALTAYMPGKIQYWINNTTNKTVETIELFYT